MTKSERVPLFDLVRGFALVCMIVYHGVYDWALFSHNLSFVDQPWMVASEAAIAWTFIFLSGWMVRFSHNNIRRGLWYLFWAFIVFLTTTIVNVDIPITYGVLFCLGASTLIVGMLQKMLPLPSHAIGALIPFLLFLLLYGIPQHRLGIGLLSWSLPSSFSQLYGHGLAFLGLPGTSFQSGDYFPLIPFFFLYLAGTIVGRSISDSEYGKKPFSFSWKPINWLGQHSLLVYLIHQPILLGVFWIASHLRD